MKRPLLVLIVALVFQLGATQAQMIDSVICSFDTGCVIVQIDTTDTTQI